MHTVVDASVCRTQITVFDAVQAVCLEAEIRLNLPAFKITLIRRRFSSRADLNVLLPLRNNAKMDRR